MATWFHEMKIPSLLFSLLIEHPSYTSLAIEAVSARTPK